jgi:phage recombination protein Bet
VTITPHHESTLAITNDQIEFTPQQVKALEHLGVENATDADLQVFFHQCKVRGLDPFVKQIHMIGRTVSVRDDSEPSGWRRQIKQTIQTGIDGFRLIGRRAADHARHKVSVQAPEWAHRDGTWRPVWDREWGVPLAARVVITRDGEPFHGVALFDEYKQIKQNGHLTATWEQRPAGQLAKCAEALAWRMAFPEDLSGIYLDEEMDHTDNPAAAAATVTTTATHVTAEDITGAAAPAPASDPGTPTPSAEPVGSPTPGPAVEGGAPGSEPPPDDMITSEQSTEIGQLLQQIGVTERSKAVAYLNDCLPDGREVRARNQLTRAEADGILLSLRDDAARVLQTDAQQAQSETKVD